MRHRKVVELSFLHTEVLEDLLVAILELLEGMCMNTADEQGQDYLLLLGCCHFELYMRASEAAKAQGSESK